MKNKGHLNMASNKKPRKSHNRLKTIAARRSVEALAKGVKESGRQLSDHELSVALADVQRLAFCQAQSITLGKKRPLEEAESDDVLKLVHEVYENIESGKAPTELDIGFIEACITTVAKYSIDTNNKPLEKLAERGLVAAKAMRAKKVFYGSYRFDQHTKPPIVDGLNKYIELVTKLTAGELQALGEFVKGHDFRVNPFGVEEAA